MIDSKKEQWGNRIRVIAFGIDKDKAKLKEAINAKGLTAFEHYNVTKQDKQTPSDGKTSRLAILFGTTFNRFLLNF